MRTIIHCDMNNFYASVELLDRPELADLPVAICGNPENRHGIILAKNQIAKKWGVLTAETIFSARKKCPSIVFLPPKYEKYRKFYKLINQIYCQYTDLVEPYSIDESWLDVTSSRKLFGSGTDIACDIQKRIKKELGLSVSAGVSFNKIFAKMGSNLKISDGPFSIPYDKYKEILWPRPIEDLFYVGKKTAEKMTSQGIRTIGDLANSDPNLIMKLYGKHGLELYRYAWGEDDTPVNPHPPLPKSLGAGITFKRDLKTASEAHTAIRILSDKVAGRVRKRCLYANGIKIEIKYPSFSLVSKQTRLSSSTDSSGQLFKAGVNLFHDTWDKRTNIRSITFTAIYLTEEQQTVQLSFFNASNTQNDKSKQVDRALDKIRGKYGKHSISFASVINNEIGLNEIEFDEINDEEDLTLS